MAYVTAKQCTQTREALKEAFPTWRFAVKKDHGTISVSILAGPINFVDAIFSDQDKKFGRHGVNIYWISDHYKQWPMIQDALLKIVAIIKYGTDHQYYNNSDVQTDYFDTAFYINLTIGSSNKEYKHTLNLKPAKVDKSKISDAFWSLRDNNYSLSDVDTNSDLGLEPIRPLVSKEQTEEVAAAPDYEEVEVEKKLTSEQLLIETSCPAMVAELKRFIEDHTWVFEEGKIIEMTTGE